MRIPIVFWVCRIVAVVIAFLYPVPSYAAGQFTPRRGHASAVFLDRMWVIGGDSGSQLLNDVWSSAEGVNWSQVTPAAAFSPRSEAACVVVGNKLVLAGGRGQSALQDVFESEDGITWKLIGVTGSPRFDHSLVMFGGSLWLHWGQQQGTMEGAMTSSSDGWSWTPQSLSPGYLARSGHTASVLGEKLVVVGGQTWGYYQKPILISSDAINWNSIAPPEAFRARIGHSSALLDGRLYVVGGGVGGIDGPQSELLSEVWSTTDGESWVAEPQEQGFPPRTGHTCLSQAGRIWILGGGAATGLTGDVYASRDGRTWQKTSVEPTPTPTPSPTPSPIPTASPYPSPSPYPTPIPALPIGLEQLYPVPDDFRLVAASGDHVAAGTSTDLLAFRLLPDGRLEHVARVRGLNPIDMVVATDYIYALAGRDLVVFHFTNGTIKETSREAVYPGFAPLRIAANNHGVFIAVRYVSSGGGVVPAPPFTAGAWFDTTSDPGHPVSRGTIRGAALGPSGAVGATGDALVFSAGTYLADRDPQTWLITMPTEGLNWPPRVFGINYQTDVEVMPAQEGSSTHLVVTLEARSDSIDFLEVGRDSAWYTGRRLGDTHLGTAATRLASGEDVSGESRLFVACGKKGVVAVDPFSVRVASTIATRDDAKDVAWAGGRRLVVADGLGGLSVIDYSRTSPDLLAGWNPTPAIHGEELEIDNGYLVVRTGNMRQYYDIIRAGELLEIGDPASLGPGPMAYCPSEVEFSLWDDCWYPNPFPPPLCRTWGVRIEWLAPDGSTHPLSSPTIASGSPYLSADAEGIASCGRYAFVASTSRDLIFVNAADLGSPKFTSVTTRGTRHRVVAGGGYCAFLDDVDGLLLYRAPGGPNTAMNELLGAPQPQPQTSDLNGDGILDSGDILPIDLSEE